MTELIVEISIHTYSITIVSKVPSSFSRIEHTLINYETQKMYFTLCYIWNSAKNYKAVS